MQNLLCSVFTSELSDDYIFPKIESSKSLLLACGNSKYKIHIEDLGFLKDLKQIEKLLAIKPFSCSLTWNNDNQFAGGNFGFRTISKNGKNLIFALQHNQIVVDTAHLNQKSFNKFLSLNSRPIFCSHTGLNFIKKSPRNLTNSQVKEIISSGGYYGLFLSSTFMANSGKLSSKIFANIIYNAFCKFGDKSIGLGSDFYGITPNPTDISSYACFAKVSNELAKNGVKKESINRFFFKNFEIFAQQSKFYSQ